MDALAVTDAPRPVRKVTAAHLDRADRAWMARVAGGTWAQAAVVSGYSNPQAAMKGVRTVYGRLPRLERDDLRDLWRARLEALWRQCLVDVTQQRAGAVMAGVRIAGAACALDGLNEAVRVDVSLDTLDRLTAELIANDL